MNQTRCDFTGNAVAAAASAAGIAVLDWSRRRSLPNRSAGDKGACRYCGTGCRYWSVPQERPHRRHAG